MFDEVMSADQIVPELARRGKNEQMHVELSNFHGEQGVSARAVLSESYRNALAISVFLAAAISHNKVPRFIVLDDATSSFDSGHQYHLMEQIRMRFQAPSREDGIQFIVLSHDVALEKYFERLSQDSGWRHQKLQGWPPLTPVVANRQDFSSLKKDAEHLLKQGKTQEAAGLIRQYLEAVLFQIIRKVNIPVPIDLAVNDHKKMVQDCIQAITSAVELYQRAGDIALDQQQIDGLTQYHVPALTGNWINHHGTGGVSMFTPNALSKVIRVIDDIKRCFQYDLDGTGNLRFYKSLEKCR